VAADLAPDVQKKRGELLHSFYPMKYDG
jgi:hypothetical protein